MIEELYSTFKYKVEQEVFKQTSDIRESPFKEGNENMSPGLMERMVEK